MSAASCDTAPSTRAEFHRRARALASRPGVYLFRRETAVLYVGKAANLRNRVSSYFSGRAANTRITHLVASLDDFEVILTRTEAEALLLEDRLIKENRPPYNIMLRDDKSYPWIRLSEHRAVGIYFHRGARQPPHKYFGPFANAAATRTTITEIRRAFRLRNCTDSVFSGRSRPCLQYQINRCSAPCVGLISEQDYGTDCVRAARFLAGNSLPVLEELGDEMEAASQVRNYERAGRMRDRISSLQRVRENQAVYASKENDCDVLAAVGEGGEWGGDVCVGMLQVRGGALLSSSTHFPRMPKKRLGSKATVADEGLLAFLSRWYLSNPAWIPPVLLVPPSLSGVRLLSEAFSRAAGHKVRVRLARRGQPLEWIQLARTQAEAQWTEKLKDSSRFGKRMAALGKMMGLEKPPQKLECYDASHHGGENAVVSCVVFGAGGPLRNEWRFYKLCNTVAGDDYGALKEAIFRRYRSMPPEQWPDIMVLDGGKGQLSVVMAQLDELQVKISVVMAIAKGPSRRAGAEQLFCGQPPVQVDLQPNGPERLLVQHVRDEAHKLANRAHRRGMRGQRKQSVLEQIPGIGPTARQALLRHFGGLREVKRADTSALCKVAGIGPDRARNIYEHLHG